MPWRAAARSSSTASWPSRGAPLPSRSIRARLCLAIATLAVGGLAIPVDGARRIALDDEAAFVHHADIEGRLRRASCGRAQQPAGAGLLVLGHARCPGSGGAPSPPWRELVGIGAGPQLVDRQRRPVDRGGRLRRGPAAARASAAAGVRRRDGGEVGAAASGGAAAGTRSARGAACGVAALRRGSRARPGIGDDCAAVPQRPRASTPTARRAPWTRRRPVSGSSRSSPDHSRDWRAGEGIARWRTTIRVVSSRTAPAWCGVASAMSTPLRMVAMPRPSCSRAIAAGRQRLRLGACGSPAPARPAPAAWRSSDG